MYFSMWVFFFFLKSFKFFKYIVIIFIYSQIILNKIYVIIGNDRVNIFLIWIFFDNNLNEIIICGYLWFDIEVELRQLFFDCWDILL